MKKYILVLGVMFLASSCKTEYQRALQSADKDFMLQIANQKFQNKKWTDALALYERLGNLVAGTDDAADVVFNTAYANYYDKNYKLAGYHFKNFANAFPNDPRKEEAAYLAALCYYQGSLDYNLDQTSTESAINELQDFLTTYPNSERSKNIQDLIDELSYKLEFKAYENARQYFKMADYKAADVTFDNVLDDFPSTKLRPKIYDYIMKSRYELAVHSVFDLKRDRIDRALAFAKQVENEMPNSPQAKNAEELKIKLEKEKEQFAIVEKEVEARKEELKKKQEALEKKLQDEERTKKMREAAKAQRDSAQQATPSPDVKINLK